MKVKLNGNDFFNVSSPFGSIDGVHSSPHTGLDLAMDIGTKLYSPTDGIVTKVVDYGSNNIGKGVYIETDDHQTVIMGHLSDIKAQVGQKVQEGDFVAWSGSTGHSTGGHLHLGLKDVNGSFIDPKPLVENANGDGIIGSVRTFMEFTSDVKHNGLFHAIYGKDFFQVMSDFFSQLGHDIGIAILGNSELIFVIPAVILMFGTWVAGRNKYTKWIIPLWMGYLFAKFFYYMVEN
jgi:hypothetical protein